MATFVIGDIHANLAALKDLLAQITPQLQEDDTLVFLGDYIDRGPDARGCVDRILDLREETAARVVTLMGNHEDWLLRSLNDPTRHSWLLGMEAFDTIESYSHSVAERLRKELEEAGPRLLTERVALPYELLIEAMSREHINFFRRLHPYHRSADALCVHAGLDPSVMDVSEQSPDVLLWGDDQFPDGYLGDELVVYGHRGDALVDDTGWPRPRIGERTAGLDTISKGVLTAIRLPGMEVVQSRRHGGTSNKALHQPKRGVENAPRRP
jgi:serine/threonine protein phosphatase 1